MSATVATPATTFGPFERIEFPNGTEIYYRDDKHSYWAGIKPKGNQEFSGTGRLTGVTTVVGPYDFRADSLVDWGSRIEREAIVRCFGGRTLPDDPGPVYGTLRNHELTWKQVRDAAGKRGRETHDLILNALARGEAPDLGQLAEDQRGYGQGVYRWWLDREPKVTHAEQVVASTEHGVAGRLDLRCRIKDPLRSGHTIVDLKTGGFLPSKAFVQPAGYSLLGMHSGFWDEPADWLLIVQVNASGGYREVWSPATHDDFLCALTLYRRAAEFAKVAKAA